MGVKIAIAFPDKGDTHSFTTESFQMGDWVFRVPHGFQLIAMLDIILIQFISSESMLWEEIVFGAWDVGEVGFYSGTCIRLYATHVPINC